VAAVGPGGADAGAGDGAILPRSGSRAGKRDRLIFPSGAEGMDWSKGILVRSVGEMLRKDYKNYKTLIWSF
jgi:hypothetical protein